MSFSKDVDKGLSADRKFLSSKYFYDAKGDQLFQDIMKMPEYYLTDCEYEIFSTRAADILHAFSEKDIPFDLVEFGAGDGTKTKILIRRLLENGANFRYIPIDISGDVLESLSEGCKTEFPELEVRPANSDYFAALDNLRKESGRPKLILFIGSSIGNFKEDAIHSFLTAIWEKLNSGDQLLIGFDLQKNPKTILDAYNDPTGITKAFNLNLLRRINRELQGDFNIDAFDHYAVYDPQDGVAKSYLVSLKQQTVQIGKLNKEYHFSSGETIHTEVSRKFRLADIERYFKESDFEVIEHFMDCKHYFVDTLAKKK